MLILLGVRPSLKFVFAMVTVGTPESSNFSIARMITSGSESSTFSCSFPRARRFYPVFLSWVWWIFTSALSAAVCDGVRRDRREQMEFCSPLAVIIFFSPQSSPWVSGGICGEKSGKKAPTCYCACGRHRHHVVPPASIQPHQFVCYSRWILRPTSGSFCLRWAIITVFHSVSQDLGWFGCPSSSVFSWFQERTSTYGLSIS